MTYLKNGIKNCWIGNGFDQDKSRGGRNYIYRGYIWISVALHFFI